MAFDLTRDSGKFVRFYFCWKKCVIRRFDQSHFVHLSRDFLEKRYSSATVGFVFRPQDSQKFLSTIRKPLNLKWHDLKQSRNEKRNISRRSSNHYNSHTSHAQARIFVCNPSGFWIFHWKLSPQRQKRDLDKSEKKPKTWTLWSTSCPNSARVFAIHVQSFSNFFLLFLWIWSGLTSNFNEACRTLKLFSYD